MSNIKKPDYYATPLRSREAIADYLASIGGYYSGYGREGRSYFSFNVKCYGVDLDFEHLLAKYREMGYYGADESWLDNPEWLEQARAVHKKVEEHLFEWGREDACRGIADDDTYNILWDGTVVDVTYCFMGRSSGYVGIKSFEGYDFSQERCRDSWYDTFRGNPHKAGTVAAREWNDTDDVMPYATLRKLYALVVMLEHDFTPEKAAKEVEYHAAFNFIENACCNIPRYTHIQRELAFSL